jgi:hypothetical protein
MFDAARPAHKGLMMDVLRLWVRDGTIASADKSLRVVSWCKPVYLTSPLRGGRGRE